MTHHISGIRPRAARESVQSSVAREVMIWFIPRDDPNDHTFQAAMGAGDMALTPAGDVWLFTGIGWALLVASRTDAELRVRNLRVLADSKSVEVEYEDKQ